MSRSCGPADWGEVLIPAQLWKALLESSSVTGPVSQLIREASITAQLWKVSLGAHQCVTAHSGEVSIPAHIWKASLWSSSLAGAYFPALGERSRSLSNFRESYLESLLAGHTTWVTLGTGPRVVSAPTSPRYRI